MKDSKKRKGTKVVLTRGKRVSLRCPLAIDRTDLEYNYDADTAQIRLTVENMGGGGVSDDSVESAIVVIRLFDAKGEPVPCTKNEYFAKLLRFGDEGLPSGSQITFRLTPDCDGGQRVTNLEIYISRVRYADGTVTDYLRGDFFDLPGDAIPLQKKHKKDLPAITEKFGASARYVPEALTEIIWRCTCGEFCESDQCTTCGATKAELFDYFATEAPKAPAAPIVTAPAQSATDHMGTPAASASDSASSPNANQATAEYDTGTFAGIRDAAQDAQTVPAAPDTASNESAPVKPAPAKSKKKKVDKLKITLIAAISVSGVILAFVVDLLIFIMVARVNHGGSSTETTTNPPITTLPPVTDEPISDEEKIVRAYLEQNNFDNALGYARSSGCSDELIREILTTAVDYYTNVAPDVDMAMKYAEELNDISSIESLNLQKYNEAIAKGDFTTAIKYAEKLTTDKDAELLAAAEGLLQSQLSANDFDAAIQTANTYPTTTKEADIKLAAINYYTEQHEYDKAIELAQESSAADQVASIAKLAVTYYSEQQNYERAADYVKLTGDTADIAALLPNFSEAALKRHLPLFFSYLTFDAKQAVHASVMSANDTAGVVDVYGNAYWGADQAYTASESGKIVVSIKSTQNTTVLLFSDGSVSAFFNNDYSQDYGQCDVQSWRNIVAIDASNYHTVGLTADGTVVATGRKDEGQCNVGEYTDVVAVAAGSYHTMMLRSDGTVASVGMTTSNQCNTSDWTDIVMISAGHLHSVGLKSDGTVVAAGSSGSGRCDVDGWNNVIQISAGESCTVGLTANGTLLLASDDSNDGDVSKMSNIIWVSAGSDSVTALRSDGGLVSTGSTLPVLDHVAGQVISTNVYGVH